MPNRLEARSRYIIHDTRPRSGYTSVQHDRVPRMKEKCTHVKVLLAVIVEHIILTPEDLQCILIPPSSDVKQEIINMYVKPLVHRLLDGKPIHQKTALILLRSLLEHHKIRKGAKLTAELASELKVIEVLIRTCNAVIETENAKNILPTLDHAE